MTLLLTALAMMAFAANSLLARAALSGAAIDAAGFTALRLAAGAVALGGMLWMRQRRAGAPVSLAGGWVSGLALFAYAIAFSAAYLRLGAATGALILFASVQLSMIAWGLLRGHRPTPSEVAGLAIAAVSFGWLLLPGIATPDPAGAVLMATAGVAWGVYSLRGRGSRDPLADTAGNFVRALPFCLPLLAFADPLPVWGGVGLAVASGAVTSGLGYAVWYRVLPRLSPIQAATVQLTVPVLAAIGAVLLLSEELTSRLVVASVAILGGVALCILSRRS